MTAQQSVIKIICTQSSSLKSLENVDFFCVTGWGGAVPYSRSVYSLYATSRNTARTWSGDYAAAQTAYRRFVDYSSIACSRDRAIFDRILLGQSGDLCALYTARQNALFTDVFAIKYDI